MRVLVVLIIAVSLMLACGDAPESTTLSVELADYQRFAEPLSLEYELQCEESPSTTGEPPLEGDFEPASPGAVNGEPGSLWTASIDARPGPCTATVVLRDNDGEFLCAQEEEFIVNADARTEVRINYDQCEDFTF